MNLIAEIRECKGRQVTGTDVAAYCPGMMQIIGACGAEKNTEEGGIIRMGAGKSTFYIRSDSRE